MQKWIFALGLAVFLVLALMLFPDPIPGWKTPEGLTFSQSLQIRKELRQVLPLSGDRDTLETQLMANGLCVEDSNLIYPACLANARPVRDYAAGNQPTLSVFQVTETGRLFHLFFTRDVLALTTLEGGQVTEQEVLPLYEAELSEGDVFYYRCYPFDPHYIDYGYFRLTPPDRTLYDLTRTYILPVGYQIVNLFLTDWQEGNWGSLCLNDTFEYLYALEYGEEFPWQDLPPQSPGWYAIPAELFEAVILPYFDLTRQELRELCRYDESRGAYPWRPVEGNEMIGLEHEVRLPEVIQAEEKPAGTLTLTVRVACPDRKTDNRFTHEVSVRPTATGFQYVGNRVTYVSDLGLPPSISRFDLGTS